MRSLAPLCGLLIFALAACSDGPIDTSGPAGVRVVAGSAASDTIDALIPQSLVVELRDPSGQLVRGSTVRFESLPPTDSLRRNEVQVQVCGLAQLCNASAASTFATDTTNSSGRASVLVRLGRVAGSARVRITVPEFGYVDSASFDVKPGVAVRVRAARASAAVDIGGTTSVPARVVDRYENTRAETPTLTLGPGSAITLNANGTVTGRELGTQFVFARFGSMVDSTGVRATPPGRLLVWTSPERAIRIVNLNGTETRTLATSVSSDYGALPRFDSSRERVTFHMGVSQFGGVPTSAVIIDTTGANRRDVMQTSSLFQAIVTTRLLPSGVLLVVATRSGSSGFSVWSVATDNTVTLVRSLPTVGEPYAAYDISPDGSRVAYGAGAALSVMTLATGAVQTVDASGRSPRWSASGDRIAFLAPTGGLDGTVVIVNADGTGRRAISSDVFSPGISWSPDGAYIIGRSSAAGGLRVLRVSDGVSIVLTFPSPNGGNADYYQPDWR